MARARLPDGTVTFLVFGLLIATAYAYAGNWPPAVIIESSSMMHHDEAAEFGRIGTIDPGDMVLVKRVDLPEDVETLLDGDRERYGAPGDALVFRPGGRSDGTAIIHRAIAYVEVDESTAGPATYRVRWNEDTPCLGGSQRDGKWCRFGADGIRLAHVGIIDRDGAPYRPNADGFITKGDNPTTNPFADPVAGISRTPMGEPSVVKMDWVVGVGRGELPWLGLLKLALLPTPNEAAPPENYVRIGNAHAPADLWMALAISLTLLLGGAYLAGNLRDRRRARREHA